MLEGTFLYIGRLTQYERGEGVARAVGDGVQYAWREEREEMQRVELERDRNLLRGLGKCIVHLELLQCFRLVRSPHSREEGDLQANIGSPRMSAERVPIGPFSLSLLNPVQARNTSLTSSPPIVSRSPN